MSEMLYLQTERNIKITSPVVTLGDVAQLSCSDGAVLARNQVRRVAHLPDDGYGRYVCSASTLVRLVTEAEEHVDVTHIGEPNFILTYEDPRQKNTWISDDEGVRPYLSKLPEILLHSGQIPVVG